MDNTPTRDAAIRTRRIRIRAAERLICTAHDSATATAADQRETALRQIEAARRELRALEALPADASPARVRAAVGLAGPHREPRYVPEVAA